jgi:anti-sigma B factor antagonist
MNSTTKVILPPSIFDGVYGKQLRQEVEDAMQFEIETVLLDCQNVTFMDSSGLGAIVIAFKQTREANKRLCFCSLSPQVQLLFDLTDVVSIFEIFEDLAAFDRQAMVASKH